MSSPQLFASFDILCHEGLSPCDFELIPKMKEPLGVFSGCYVQAEIPNCIRVFDKEVLCLTGLYWSVFSNIRSCED